MNENIYHYCSVDTLEKILANRTIRFSRFDKMDDQTETVGLPEMLKKTYFLSCWVADGKEKIPQWAMYAPKGVRIELPIKWYTKHLIPIADTNEFIERLPLDDGQPGEHTFYPFPFSDWWKPGNKYALVPPFDEDEGFVVKVIYSDDFLKFKKESWRTLEDGKSISMIHPAEPIKYKDSYWSFQEEIRFYLYTFCKHEDRNELPHFFDLPINEEALKLMKVRAYPNCSKEDFDKIREIISDNFPAYDSDEIIERSALDGKYFPKINK